MQHEAFSHHLNDVARFGAGHRGFKHRFMHFWVKLIANFRRQQMNAVLVENAQKRAHGQLDTFQQSLVRFASFA